MCGILVIDRMHFLKRVATLTREPACHMPHEEVHKRYRGVDGGLAWPESEKTSFELRNGIAPLSVLKQVREYFLQIVARDVTDMIVISSSGIENSQLCEPIYRFLGYDVGFVESAWSHYSVVFGEVIYGIVPDMRAYASRLNQSLLFDSLSDAQSLVEVHELLKRRGVGLEDGNMEVIAIHEPSITGSNK